MRLMGLILLASGACTSDVVGTSSSLDIDLGTGTYEGRWVDDAFHAVPRPLDAHAIARFDLPRCGLVEVDVAASSHRVSEVDRWSLVVMDGATMIGTVNDEGVSGDATLSVDATGGADCTAVVNGPGAPRRDLLWSVTVSP